MTRNALAMTIAALATVSAAFECDGRALPGAYLNDDYCDCADGSDEAATGACADTIYVCRNLPHKPKQIFSSRVNDGVCDCCDGSDEANSTDCPNGCIALATEAFGALSRGCLRRAELAIAAAKAASSDAERLSAARAQLATATPTIDALHDAKAAAEADEASKRDGRAARLAAGEVETSLGVERLDAGMTLRALVRVALWGGVEGVDRMYDLLVERPGLEEAAEEVDSADLLEVAMKARDEAAAEKGQSAGGGGGGGVCDAAGACGHAREHEAALLQLLEPLPEDGGALRAVLRALHAGLAPARRLSLCGHFFSFFCRCSTRSLAPARRRRSRRRRESCWQRLRVRSTTRRSPRRSSCSSRFGTTRRRRRGQRTRLPWRPCKRRARRSGSWRPRRRLQHLAGTAPGLSGGSCTGDASRQRTGGSPTRRAPSKRCGRAARVAAPRGSRHFSATSRAGSQSLASGRRSWRGRAARQASSARCGSRAARRVAAESCGAQLCTSSVASRTRCWR
mmetsp:Transcript_36728/g.118760  ORF Transcript_36728/g.118760 Transcript_36728/m.118760 type:complete len:511 (-) Transcript_36728:393-1925(-)